VEAAAPLGWDRYVGPKGEIIAMRRFGASAPIKGRSCLASASAGQAVWLDYLHRKILEDGELERLIEEDGLKGLTSNPSIFEKAIGEGDAYDDRLKPLKRGDADRPALYERLAIADIQAAADQLRPVYDATKGATASSAWRSRPIWPWTPRAPSPRRGGCGARWTGPT
jgi:hypothetical protein